MVQVSHIIAMAIVLLSMTSNLQGCSESGDFLAPQSSAGDGVTIVTHSSGDSSNTFSNIESAGNGSVDISVVVSGNGSVNISNILSNRSEVDVKENSDDARRMLGCAEWCKWTPSRYWQYDPECESCSWPSSACVPAGSTLQSGQECCSDSRRYQANGGAWCKPLSPTSTTTTTSASNLPKCVPAGWTVHAGQECCKGSWFHQQQYGALCQPCTSAGNTLEDGQECCPGSMRYQANGGAWCKASPPACVPAGSTLQSGQECCSDSRRYQANGGAWCKPLSPTSTTTTATTAGQMPPAATSWMLHWSYEEGSGASDITDYCMSVRHNNFRNGERVQLWSCDASASGQHFLFSNGGNYNSFSSLLQVSAAPEFCVVSANGGENGAQIQLGQCEAGNLAQIWTQKPTSAGTQLRNAAFPNMCLVHRPDFSKTIELLACDENEGYNSWYSN